MIRYISICIALLLPITSVSAQQKPAQDNSIKDESVWQKDALELEVIINNLYAYLDRLNGNRFILTDKLRAEAKAVNSQSSLLLFVERALFLLYDHHAITGPSFNNSWGLVPSYSGLWIEKQSNDYIITSVRNNSPAQSAGIKKNDLINSILDIPIDEAAKLFWNDLGVTSYNDKQASFAARILVTGRRNKSRNIGIKTSKSSEIKNYNLPNLYTVKRTDALLLTSEKDETLIITINDSLGNNNLIPAFDKAMQQAKPNQRITIDLRNTPSGGNTVIARAMMGWFVNKATPFQIHILPEEEKRTGIKRQWAEYVLPRGNKYHQGPITIWVGRWTGSMGEGIAVGMDHKGANVQGEKMAGLLGANYDLRLPNSGLLFKIPVERLLTVNGTAREDFIPSPI